MPPNARQVSIPEVFEMSGNPSSMQLACREHTGYKGLKTILMRDGWLYLQCLECNKVVAKLLVTCAEYGVTQKEDTNAAPTTG